MLRERESQNKVQKKLRFRKRKNQEQQVKKRNKNKLRTASCGKERAKTISRTSLKKNELRTKTSNVKS